jgi:hypothetical protein
VTGVSTPPGALPVIKDGMQIRFDLRTLIGLVGAIIGGAIFCTVFYLKVDNFDKRLARIERALGIDSGEPNPNTSTRPSGHGGANP